MTRTHCFGEEVGVGELAVGEHLLLVLVFDFRVEVRGRASLEDSRAAMRMAR